MAPPRRRRVQSRSSEAGRLKNQASTARKAAAKAGQGDPAATADQHGGRRRDGEQRHADGERAPCCTRVAAGDQQRQRRPGAAAEQQQGRRTTRPSVRRITEFRPIATLSQLGWPYAAATLQRRQDPASAGQRELLTGSGGPLEMTTREKTLLGTASLSREPPDTGMPEGSWVPLAPPIQRRTALATAASLGSLPFLDLLPEAFGAIAGPAARAAASRSASRR